MQKLVSIKVLKLMMSTHDRNEAFHLFFFSPKYEY